MYLIYLFLLGDLIFKFIEANLRIHSFLYPLLGLQENNSSTILLLILVIGGLILTTLIYVGYRKYRGEKEKEKERERGRDKTS